MGGGADLSKILSKETLFANLQNPNPWGKRWRGGGAMKYLKLLFCHYFCLFCYPKKLLGGGGNSLVNQYSACRFKENVCCQIKGGGGEGPPLPLLMICACLYMYIEFSFTGVLHSMLKVCEIL